MPPRVLFVSHEASLTGAPIMLLQFLRWLHDNDDLEMQVLLIADGELASDFAAVAPVTVMRDPMSESRLRWLLWRLAWDDPLLWPVPTVAWPLRSVRLAARGLLLAELRRRLRLRGPGSPDLIYLNSTASARALSLLDDNVPVITHAHEMGGALRSVQERAPWAVGQMRKRTRRYIAASGAVKAALADVLAVNPAQVDVCYEAVVAGKSAPDTLIEQARHELGLSRDTLVVGSVGALNWRKAPDLFLHVAKLTLGLLGSRDAQFVWVGPTPPNDATESRVREDLARAGLAEKVRFVGPRDDPRPVMELFDIFVLTSREDPFPLACLEAAMLGKPIVCFDAGGMSEFIRPDERLVVPYLDLDAMSHRIVELLGSPAERERLGRALARRVTERHTLDRAARILLNTIHEVLRESSTA